MLKVVTCLLEHDGKILLLKRSNRVGTYQGLWGGVAGYVEEQEDPYDTALKEILEETGLDIDMLTLVKKGPPLEISDTYKGKRYDWIVYPFLFHIKDKNHVRIDWEHEKYQWIHPLEVKKINTVPDLEKVIALLIE
jgi:8-oxo-dGTP diphosphatase